MIDKASALADPTVDAALEALLSKLLLAPSVTRQLATLNTITDVKGLSKGSTSTIK